LPDKLKYEPAFDGIRAVAIIVVIAAHMFPSLWEIGALAVNVFFVLSGYLITRLLIIELESTNTINLSSFYMRRALRLMQPLWAMLLIFLPVTTTELLSYKAGPWQRRI
jgi:peptidoglycan/LPS O-acetylase OafA/YrhL